MLKGEYSENPLINFLLYKKNANETSPTPEGLFQKKYSELTRFQRAKYCETFDNWRRRNELDVLYLNGDLHADTIFSVWMPLKMCLQVSDTYPYFNQGAKEKPYASNTFISNIIKNIDKYLPFHEWKEFYQFVSLAMTRANVMKLPERNMQSRAKFYDQMPKTLYECFDNGEFSSCFKNISVGSWVADQHLAMFFKSEVSRVDIKPLISNMAASEYKWLTNKEQLLEMFSNYINILKVRNNIVEEKL